MKASVPQVFRRSLAIVLIGCLGAPFVTATGVTATGVTATGVTAAGMTADGVKAALPPSPAEPSNPVTDTALFAAMRASNVSNVSNVSDRSERYQRTPTVNVEVLTRYTTEVERTVRNLGGSVSGAVDGQVVQADMPTSAVDKLALANGVDYVRSPVAVTRPVASRIDRATQRLDATLGTGPVVGENVQLTNASAWRDAGITGAVKIGIVDFFNVSWWDPAENGPLPDANHRFCQDSANDGSDACSPAVTNGPKTFDGYEHGVAVAQVLKDVAPDAELYLATVMTVSDLRAAIDFFAADGVHIITRSLGAAFDGPGDGTGPLDAVVDYAASRGITWFNSAGNDAQYGYARITVPVDLSSTNGYVDFDNGPGVDTLLRISGPCVLFDGVRWSDWNLPPSQRTDYSIELFEPTSNPDVAGHDENFNPDSLISRGVSDAAQAAGAPPLEMANGYVCAKNTYGADGGIMYMRIHRKSGTPVVGPPDVLEIAVAQGYLESNRWQAAYSAAKPVVDSRNPALVAVGAVDPANGMGGIEPVGVYSSQGPTNDGRIKPDVSAPACVKNAIYAPCFSGTSAASPTAAGVAAILLDAGVATVGAPLAAGVMHFVLDRPFVNAGPPDGADNKYGTGEILLPNPPPRRVGQSPPQPGAPSPSSYRQVTPIRILDTRPTSQVGATIGQQPQEGIVDVSLTAVGVPATATAVAVNITATDTLSAGFVQAVPYLQSTYGTSSTLNITNAGSTTANFAIVPIGFEGKISIYLVSGGNVIVDVLGYFAPSAPTAAAGRFVAIDPVRTLDTRSSNLVPAGWVARKPNNESVVVPSTPAVPAGVSALVLNVTSTGAAIPGYLRAQPTGTAPTSSTVNYVARVDASNSVIVPVGADGTVSIFTNAASNIVVDITGYITGAGAPVTGTGLFVPVVTARAFDSRTPAPGSAFATASVHAVQLTGLAAPLPVVPAHVSGVSANLTAADQIGSGYLSAYAAGGPTPATSSLNYVSGQPVANGLMIKLSDSGALSIYANLQADVIIDVNGYFL